MTAWKAEASRGEWPQRTLELESDGGEPLRRHAPSLGAAFAAEVLHSRSTQPQGTEHPSRARQTGPSERAIKSLTGLYVGTGVRRPTEADGNGAALRIGRSARPAV